MARDIDMSGGVESLSQDDLQYLAARGRLTAEQERTLLTGEADAPEAPDLSLVPNTGDVGGPDDQDEDAGDDSTGEDDDDVAYEDMNVDDLKTELKARDLPVSGTKDELIARLETDDEA